MFDWTGFKPKGFAWRAYSPQRGARVKGKPWEWLCALVLYAATVSACGAGSVPIHAIQGSDDASPYEGNEVRLLPVAVTVVGERGYFIQTPPGQEDDNSATSEGLYVFTGDSPPVTPGERISLKGRVLEFHGHTQLVDPHALTRLGRDTLPEPAVLARTGMNLEALESMRVSISLGTVTGPSDKHGDALVVPGDERLFRYKPQPSEAVTWFELDPDALGLENRLLASPRHFAAEGVLVYRYGDYVLWPTALELGPAPALPLPVRVARPGEVSVASFNLRLFYDERRVAGEPVTDPEAFHLRLDKLSGWLDRVLQCPTIVAVQEVEALDVLERLAEASNCGYRALADNHWRDMPGLGYLVRDDYRRPLQIEPWGEDLRLSTDGSPLFGRPPLVLEAGWDNQQPGEPLTIVNVHLRSMRGLGEEPRVARKRYEQALALRNLVEQLHGQGARHILVLGDFNAFPFDDGYADTLGIVTDAAFGLSNLIQRLPSKQRYSYVYGGRAQTLDHALVSAALEPLVSGFAYARGNADASVSLVHQTGSLLRASDHDPLVVYLKWQEMRGGRGQE